MLAEAWIELLANVGDFQERATEVEPLRRRALATLHRIGDPPELTVHYLDVQGRVDVTAGDFGAAIAHHEQSLALIDANPDLPVERRMLALMQLATAQSAFGRTERAIEHRLAALAMAREVYGLDHPRIGVILGQLGVDTWRSRITMRHCGRSTRRSSSISASGSRIRRAPRAMPIVGSSRCRWVERRKPGRTSSARSDSRRISAGPSTRGSAP